MGRNGAKMLAAAGLAMAGSALAQPDQPLPARHFPVPLDAPSVTITNGLITARIYRVDPVGGFYRGTRFDQSGVIGSLTLGTQDFYGPWFDRVAPDVLDYVYTPDGIVGGPDSAISGPAEEFAPLGYDDAQPGNNFLKIGVGLLRKPDGRPYDHYLLYDIADAGRRDTQLSADAVIFRQEIAANPTGYAYRYEKTIRLVPGKPQMVMEHVLTNTGGKPLSTSVYNHNFLKLAPGNGDVVVTLPFTPVLGAPLDPALARLDGSRLSYVRPLVERERVQTTLAGFGAAASDYDFHIRNSRTGAAVRIQGDQPLMRINYWSIRTVMAVEPYVAIRLTPGESLRWRYTYTYTAP